MPVSSSSSTGIVRPRAAAFGDLERVDGGRDRGLLRELAQPVELPLAHDRIADEHVLDPAVDHHLGLAELRHLDADRACLDLHSRDCRQLVRLDMGPHRHAGAGRHRSDPRDVRADDVEVDDDLRRVRYQLCQRGDALHRDASSRPRSM